MDLNSYIYSAQYLNEMFRLVNSFGHQNHFYSSPRENEYKTIRP